MNRTNDRFRALCRNLCLMGAMGAMTAAALTGAQAASTADMQAALQDLNALQAQVASMRSIALRPLGPYELQTECSYCSSKVFGICMRTSSETYRQRVDFSGTRAQLGNVLTQIDGQTATFRDRYGATEQWKQSLPPVDDSFGSLMSIQQAQLQGSPSPETVAMFKSKLAELVRQIGDSTQLLKAGTAQISTFLQQQEGNRQEISLALRQADALAQNELNRLVNDAQSHICQDGLEAQFNVIRAGFKQSLTDLTGALEQLEARDATAAHSVAILVAGMVDAQTTLQASLQQLDALERDQAGSFMATMHLEASRKLWHDLAQQNTADLPPAWPAADTKPGPRGIRYACPPGPSGIAPGIC